jgi:hypothetical protein
MLRPAEPGECARLQALQLVEQRIAVSDFRRVVRTDGAIGQTVTLKTSERV